MQVLAENRWEDYEWEYEWERYAYWGSGFSWIEDPEGDPLGIDERESWKTTATIPHKDSDLSYYLWKSTPLPAEAVASFRPDPEDADAPPTMVSHDVQQHDAQAARERMEKPNSVITFMEESAVVTVPV